MGVNIDEHWMQRALVLAERAQQLGEVPIGAVIVHENEIIAEGYNQPIASNDPTAHAEIIAIRQACNTQNNYRLLGTTLYVTLEPCPMCAGAMVHARIKRLVFAANDPNSGAAGTLCNIAHHPQLNHRIELTSGVLAEAASERLKAFFKARR